MGEVKFDEAFMMVLGVKPGDRISFFIDAQGLVMVKGEKQSQAFPQLPATPGAVTPSEVTQARLFDADVPAPTILKRRGKNR